MSDQDRDSPYNINTISTRKVMRIKKNIEKGIISCSNTKFSKNKNYLEDCKENYKIRSLA